MNEDAIEDAELQIVNGKLQTKVDYGTSPIFDRDTGTTVMYPSNISMREYQKDAIHKSIYTNTLLVLPTGLGM